MIRAIEMTTKLTENIQKIKQGGVSELSRYSSTCRDSMVYSASKRFLPLLNAPGLLHCDPKKVVLSGPSGFLGSHVLDSLLEVHQLRKENGLEPGEVILLSSSPGNVMKRLQRRYGEAKMKTIRASRIDYFTQHDCEAWRDQLGSLGLKGEHTVFVNLAAVAGPVTGVDDAMMDVNYRAPVAAAKACQALGFGHFIQSSTQATSAERAGQVPYSKAKAMTDFALSRMQDLPVTIASLGLLYDKRDGLIGQRRSVGNNEASLNLIDLSLLPLTPIMGDGSAPLQPQEVSDAAHRIAYLALADPAQRPLQLHKISELDRDKDKLPQAKSLRYYDAVGPETISMVNMLRKFAEFQGNKHFRPVFIDYRNMERVLNVKSLGNLNRQFVSLLRSEQGAKCPIIGNPIIWESLLGEGSRLTTLSQAFCKEDGTALNDSQVRWFPYVTTARWVINNPRVIPPGIALSFEILHSFFFGPPQSIA